jgi:hypothetical protein
MYDEAAGGTAAQGSDVSLATTTIPPFGAESHPARAIERPGISAETLARNGIRAIDASEAKELCGLDASGIWLPYFQLDGGRLVDGGVPYGRLRLDSPIDGRKYHQARGSGVHAYFPKGVCGHGVARLTLVEGEFKAIALFEHGYPSIGLGGFWGFVGRNADGEVELLPEIAAALESLRPEELVFLGDNDTALNADFPFAACKLAKLSGREILLPRIALDMPKGVDDCLSESSIVSH